MLAGTVYSDYNTAGSAEFQETAESGSDFGINLSYKEQPSPDDLRRLSYWAKSS